MIGIISDTHDNVDNIIKAIQFFKEKEVEFIIHLGDIIAPATIPFFEGLKVYFVKGNNDGDVVKLKEMISNINCEFFEDTFEIEHKGKKIVATHYPDKAEELTKGHHYDYVLHGHDHKKRDEYLNGSRLINPGAHYYKTTNTIALLDVEKDEVEFIELDH